MEKESWTKPIELPSANIFLCHISGVSMAPSGPGTIAQVCTLDYCHPANAGNGQKQDNPLGESMGAAGKGAIERGKKTCEMLIELHPLIEGKTMQAPSPPSQTTSSTWQGGI